MNGSDDEKLDWRLSDYRLQLSIYPSVDTAPASPTHPGVTLCHVPITPVCYPATLDTAPGVPPGNT